MRLLRFALCAIGALSLPASARLCAADSNPSAIAKAACVRVWATATPDGSSGSGTVVSAKGGRSLVVTCNHIFSGTRHPDGGFVDTVYPQACKVRANNKWHAGTAVAGNRTSDLAVIVVEAELATVSVARVSPAIGTEIWRDGMGTGYQGGTVLAPTKGFESHPNFSLTNSSRSGSGDSGAGYFNGAGELVGVHCGADTIGRARGTAAPFVNAFLKDRLPDTIPKAELPEPRPAPNGKVIVARLPPGRPLPRADGCVYAADGVTVIASYPLVPEWFDFEDTGDTDQAITSVAPDGTSVTKRVAVSNARWPGLNSGYTVADGGSRGTANGQKIQRPRP